VGFSLRSFVELHLLIQNIGSILVDRHGKGPKIDSKDGGFVGAAERKQGLQKNV